MTTQRLIFKSAVAAIALAFSAGAASAQACASTEFQSKNGERYLAAETLLTAEKNAAGAAAAAQALLSGPPEPLNCYEEGNVLRLLAAAQMQSGNTAGAIQTLERTISAGVVSGEELTQTYFNISQLALMGDDLRTADTYLTRWLNAGGRPTRDQNWMIATLKFKLDDIRGAVPFAERVLQADGGSAGMDVIDFLIFLYDRTGERTKKAALLERKLQVDPTDKRTWEAIAGDYFAGGDERKAFEVTKAMYLAGVLNTEDEIMRVVNFYSRFDAPFAAARILEKEMNAGRITSSVERLELLANLYQVAREYDRALPVLQRAAQQANRGDFQERVGRSYFELGRYDEAIEALQRAVAMGGLNEPAFARVFIGQAHYEQGNREAAREAFQAASRVSGDAQGVRAARGWLDFMRSEEETRAALARFSEEVKIEELVRRLDACRKGEIFAQADDDTVGEDCDAIELELTELRGDTEG